MGGGAGVFRKDEVALFENPERPEGDVLQITYRRWNYKEFGHISMSELQR